MANPLFKNKVLCKECVYLRTVSWIGDFLVEKGNLDAYLCYCENHEKDHRGIARISRRVRPTGFIYYIDESGRFSGDTYARFDRLFFEEYSKDSLLDRFTKRLCNEFEINYKEGLK